MALVVTAGAAASSVGCDDAGGGVAGNVKGVLGGVVRIVSTVVPWAVRSGIGCRVEWGWVDARTNARDTEIGIVMMETDGS